MAAAVEPFGRPEAGSPRHATASQSTQAPIKLSRYRSVRKAQSKQQELVAHPDSVPSVPPMPQTDDSQAKQGIKRSMSRYRRKQSSSSSKKADFDSPVSAPTPAPIDLSPQANDNGGEEARCDYPQGSPGLHRRRRSASGQSSKNRGTTEQALHNGERRTNAAAQVRNAPDAMHEPVDDAHFGVQQQKERSRSDMSYQSARRRKESEEKSTRRRREGTAPAEDRQGHLESAEEQRGLEGEAQQPSNTRQRGPDERPERSNKHSHTVAQSHIVTHPQNLDGQGPPQPKKKMSSSSITRRFGTLFRRKKTQDAPPHTSEEENRPRYDSHAAATSNGVPKQAARQERGDIAPMNDAPLSGNPNAERIVRIAHGRKEIRLPVELETTSSKVLHNASDLMSVRFDPLQKVLHEHFVSQQISRPLRAYEQVQKVMDSWDNDNMNVLLIQDPTDINEHGFFRPSSAWQEPTEPVSWVLDTDAKKKKGPTQCVTLYPDGQMTATRKGNTVKICHLSDFDAYRPFRGIEKLKHRMSGKSVVVLKSQERESMFLDKSTYIQHFYSDDWDKADHFFRTCRAWRSCYLKKVLGNVNRQSNTIHDHRAIAGSSLRRSSADVHHSPGGDGRLDLDFGNFGRSTGESQSSNVRRTGSKRHPQADENIPLGLLVEAVPSAQDHSRRLHERKLSQHKDQSRLPPTSMRHGVPSTSTSREGALQTLTGTGTSGVNTSDQPVFASGSLLDSQDDAGRRQSAPRNFSNPSRDSGGSSGVRRNASTRSTHAHRRKPSDAATPGEISTGVGRSTSKSQRRPLEPEDFGKPLLDFTPTYKPPPQFSNQGKGRGYVPDHVGPGGLVESATTPTTAIKLPGSDDWRVRNTATGGSVGEGLNRSRSTRDQNRPSSSSMPVRTQSTRRPQTARQPRDHHHHDNSNSHNAATATGAGTTSHQDVDEVPTGYKVRTASGTSTKEPVRTSSAEATTTGHQHQHYHHHHHQHDHAALNSGAIIHPPLPQAPLVNINEPSVFEEGSLLSNLERRQSKRR